MTINYLKKATKTAVSDEADIREAVQAILAEIRAGGEASARAYAQRFDGWEGEVVVPQDAIDQAATQLSQQEKDDIQFAHERVRAFAQAQRDSMHDFEIVQDGVTMGHRHIPVNVAGCYVPGGR